MKRVKKRFIAIAYIIGYCTFNYVLYDYYKKNIVILSEEAVRLIADKVINIEISNGFIDHLSSIWCIKSKSKYINDDIKIEINNIKDTKTQEEYVIIRLENIMHKDTETKIILFDRVKISDSEYIKSTYNVCKISIDTQDKFTYFIKIYNIIGFDFDKTEFNRYKNIDKDIVDNNSRIFMRNTVEVNNTARVKNILSGIKAKRNLANIYDNEISLYEIAEKIYLLNIYVKNKGEIVKIPRQIDSISHRVTLLLMKYIDTKEIKVVLNKKQYNSMLNCIEDNIDKIKDNFIIRE